MNINVTVRGNVVYVSDANGDSTIFTLEDYRWETNKGQSGVLHKHALRMTLGDLQTLVTQAARKAA